MKSLGVSLLFWLPLLAVLVGLVTQSEHYPTIMMPLMLGLVWIVGPFGSRLASLKMTSLYVGHVTGQERVVPKKTALLSTFVLLLPIFAGGLLTSTALILSDFEGPVRSLTGVTMAVPFALAMPFLWLAAGYWCDGASLVGGLLGAKKLLFEHASSAVVPVSIMLMLGLISIGFPPLFLIFDPLSKSVFAEVYVTATAEQPEPTMEPF